MRSSARVPGCGWPRSRGVAATLLAVVSGTIGVRPRSAISALALPPLAAVAIAALDAHRRLLWPSLAALVALRRRRRA